MYAAPDLRTRLMKLRQTLGYTQRCLTAPRLRVDFVIAGVQKGGTTALHAYLKQHPQIGLSRHKEAQFFNTDAHFQGLRPDYPFYHSLFDPHPQHTLYGEATPAYIYWQDAPRRMWEYNPQLKVILLFRNPITRAYSHWNMGRDRGTETLSFWDAIQAEPVRSRGHLPQQDKKTSYVDRGFYSEQLRRMWRYFPREQTLIFKSEELEGQPETVLRQTYAFLGVDCPTPPAPQRAHARPYTSPLEPRAQEYLQSVYEHDIRELEHMLDWDCRDWLT